MCHRIKGIVILFTIVLVTALAWGEQVGLMPIPVFTEAKVQAQVIFDSAGGLYTYSYTITNPATNTGGIWSIRIDIAHPPNGVVLSSEGLTIFRGSKTRTFAEVLAKFKGTNAPIVPVGIHTTGGWAGGLGKWGIADFTSGTGVPDILPGEIYGGFVLTSPGLPTIRRIEIIPWWIYMEDEDPTPEEDQRAREIEASLPYKTKTLGPTAPPADFKATNFIDYIITMKHEAFSLGWITNEGIENSLDAKLENAKKKLEQGNANAAKNILNALLNEVEAQNGKHLTSEAYGLLKYNVEYLIGRL